MNARLLARKLVIATLLVAVIAGAAAAKGKQELSLLIQVDDLERIVSEGDVIILDIRDQQSYLDGHIPGAMLLPLPGVENAAADIRGLGLSVITYCSCPAEESSLAAAFKLRDAGIENVYVLVGGYPEWVNRQKPVVYGSNPL